MPGRATPVARTLIALLALAAATPALAAPRERKSSLRLIGDDAPPLAVDQWIAGTPVDGLDRGRIYAIQFWNPRLGAARATLPHWAELAKTYPNVIFLTIAFNDPVNYPTSPEAVETFLGGLGIGSRLPVGYIDLSQQVGDDDGIALFIRRRSWDVPGWSEIADADGSPPRTVLVDADGRIAWVGNPMRADGPLKKLVDGTFDLTPGRRESAKLADQADEMGTIREELNAAMMNASVQRMNAAAQQELIESVYARHPAAARLLAGLRFGRFLAAKNYDEAYKAADALFEAAKDDPSALNELAWTIVDNAGVERRDLARARKYAERAVELSGGVNGAILDTLAKAIFLQGDVQKALELQRLAVRYADEGEQQEELPKTLNLYERAAATRPAN